MLVNAWVPPACPRSRMASPTIGWNPSSIRWKYAYGSSDSLSYVTHAGSKTPPLPTSTAKDSKYPPLGSTSRGFALMPFQRMSPS